MNPVIILVRKNGYPPQVGGNLLVMQNPSIIRFQIITLIAPLAKLRTGPVGIISLD